MNISFKAIIISTLTSAFETFECYQRQSRIITSRPASQFELLKGFKLKVYRAISPAKSNFQTDDKKRQRGDVKA